MTTELSKGGTMSKINLKGYLKDITNNDITSINTKAILTKKKISFHLNSDIYILKIISPTKLILNRSNNEIDSTIYFELNKTISSIYTIKENSISIEIDIKTIALDISDNHLKIIYNVVDSNTKYEYYIEMSEYK